MKQSLEGINILRKLASEGLKIFNFSQAQDVAAQLKINSHYVAEALYLLIKGGWITRLKRGLYAFSSTSGFINPPHQFEIAMALVTPCAISHWTALHYHHLTDQSPNVVFAITPNSSSIPRSLNKKQFHFVKIKNEYYFGIEKIWVEQSQINITDPERTLLDGLMKPQYCGDFQEILHAFEILGNNLNIERIINYALKLDLAVIKRLGWILEKLNIHENHLKDLLKVPIKSYRKLDPNSPAKGPYNKKWMIQENI